MITVPPAIQTALAALSDADLRTQGNEKRRDLAYVLWEAKRRGYSVDARYEGPIAATNDNEAREIQITAVKVINL